MSEETSRKERQVAKRVFAQEYRDSDLDYKDGDDQYAPKYVATPTGAEINRLFVVGALTDIEDIGTDDSYYRARVSDPTGSFLVYAGRYQPEAVQVMEDLEPPEFVATTGKSHTYRPGNDDEDEEEEETVITSVKPESVSVVTREERNRWILDTARRTIERLNHWDKRPNRVKTHYQDVSKNVQLDNVRTALRNLTGNHYDEEAEDRVSGSTEPEPAPGNPPTENDDKGDVEEWDFS